jgi:hypothetical protein
MLTPQPTSASAPTFGETGERADAAFEEQRSRFYPLDHEVVLDEITLGELVAVNGRGVQALLVQQIRQLLCTGEVTCCAGASCDRDVPVGVADVCRPYSQVASLLVTVPAERSRSWLVMAPILLARQAEVEAPCGCPEGWAPGPAPRLPVAPGGSLPSSCSRWPVPRYRSAPVPRSRGWSSPCVHSPCSARQRPQLLHPGVGLGYS